MTVFHLSWLFPITLATTNENAPPYFGLGSRIAYFCASDSTRAKVKKGLNEWNNYFVGPTYKSCDHVRQNKMCSDQDKAKRLCSGSCGGCMNCEKDVQKNVMVDKLDGSGEKEPLVSQCLNYYGSRYGPFWCRGASAWFGLSWLCNKFHTWGPEYKSCGNVEMEYRKKFEVIRCCPKMTKTRCSTTLSSEDEKLATLLEKQESSSKELFKALVDSVKSFSKEQFEILSAKVERVEEILSAKEDLALGIKKDGDDDDVDGDGDGDGTKDTKDTKTEEPRAATDKDTKDTKSLSTGPGQKAMKEKATGLEPKKASTAVPSASLPQDTGKMPYEKTYAGISLFDSQANYGAGFIFFMAMFML